MTMNPDRRLGPQPLEDIIRAGGLRKFLYFQDEFADPYADAHVGARRWRELVEYFNGLADQAPIKHELRKTIIGWFDDPDAEVKADSLQFSQMLHFNELCDKVAEYVASKQADEAPRHLKTALKDYAREFGMQDVVLRLS